VGRLAVRESLGLFMAKDRQRTKFKTFLFLFKNKRNIAHRVHILRKTSIIYFYTFELRAILHKYFE
jgi:hypothetical protein